MTYFLELYQTQFDNAKISKNVQEKNKNNHGMIIHLDEMVLRISMYILSNKK